jgi:hypothetical protein
MSSIDHLPPPPSTSTTLPSTSTLPPSITLLSLPPEGSFDSFELLLTACQRHAKAAGYAFATYKSEKRKGRAFKTLICKRGGIHRTKINEDYRIHNGGTFKHNCPVSIRAREQKDGTWTLLCVKLNSVFIIRRLKRIIMKLFST